jgi:hypothetical protein
MTDLADGGEEEEGDECGPCPVSHHRHAAGVSSKLGYILLRQKEPFPHLLGDVTHCCTHRLNMELDLPKFMWAPLYSGTHWPRPRNSPLPPHLGSNTRALLVSQDR